MDYQQEDSVKDYLSDKLIHIIEDNAEVIAGRWLEDVKQNPSTLNYARIDKDETLMWSGMVISQFGKWLGGADFDQA